MKPIDSSNSLDRLDYRILALVQENNLLPHRKIAEAVGLSTPAVTRRLQKLRQQGVIRRDASLLNAAALGRPLTIIVQVMAHSERMEDLDALRESFRDCEQVQHCHYVTGEADFILVFNVADMAEYEGLTRQLFFASGNVAKFTTMVSMESIKASEKVVLEAD